MGADGSGFPRRAHWGIPMGLRSYSLKVHAGAGACVGRRATAVWVQLCCGQRDLGTRERTAQTATRSQRRGTADGR